MKLAAIPHDTFFTLTEQWDTISILYVVFLHSMILDLYFMRADFWYHYTGNGIIKLITCQIKVNNYFIYISHALPAVKLHKLVISNTVLP